MTPVEFKAWFEGFTEAMSGAPNKEQWARIKKRVAEIDGQSVTEKIFIDRYWPRYWTPNPGAIWSTSPQWGTSATSAMYALGQAEQSSDGFPSSP